MDDEQRRAKRERDRRAAAAYRARKRVERAERERVAADGVPGLMRQSVELSLAAAKWLTGSDAALMYQARRLADIVDRAEDVRLEMRAHSLLGRVLGDLGLTPRIRMQLELRARKLQTVVEDRAIDAEPNVTRISKRPAPRKR